MDEGTIKAYIENQRWDEDDESFKITAPPSLEPALSREGFRRLQPPKDSTGFQPVVINGKWSRLSSVVRAAPVMSIRAWGTERDH